MNAHALLPIALLAGALGSPLRQDGYTFRPPESYRMVRMDLFHGTRAGAVPYPPGGARHLSAALVDGDGADAASLVVSVVEGTFVANAQTRDAFSAATLRHFSQELAMPLALDRAEWVRGPAPRVEVRGTLKQRDQVRGVLVAAMDGEGRHAVVTFSLPVARFEAELPRLLASLDSYRPDKPPQPAWVRRASGAFVAALALMLFGSWWLWRRRQRMRRADAGLPV